MSRLAELILSDPELREVAVDEAGRRQVERLTDYITADGFGVQQIVTRLERLKFETIVREKTYAEVLADEERRRG